MVEVDGEGFLTIQGRAKRFAKIAGEMISLGAIEDQAATLWPDGRHAAIVLPDARRGEQIVLVTDQGGAGREALLAAMRRAGLRELFVPPEILTIDRLPLLAT